MRTQNLFFAITIIVVITLSACGPASTPVVEQTTEQQPATEAPATEAPAPEPADISGDLTVFTWSGYDTPDFNQGFYDQYPDVNVEFAYMTSDDEAFAKMQTGFEADVILPVWHDVYVQADLMQPLDPTRLTVWNSIPDKLKEKGNIGGVQYFVPFDWGYSCILVRTDKIDKIPAKYADLWDPAYKGHLSLYDAPEEAWMVSAFAQGFDPYNTTPEQDEAIKQKLLELKPNLLTFWADPYEMAQMVSSGDLWVVIGAWTSEYIMLKGQGVPVDYVCLEEASPIWEGGIGIPKTAKNVDAAYAYIDAFLAPKPQSMLGAWGFGMANMDALEFVDPNIITDLGLDDPKKLDEAYIMRDVNIETVQKWAKMWSDVKAAP